MIGGFPIITQKRSSSSLQLVNNFVESSQELNDENDGEGCVIKHFTVPLLMENFGNEKGFTCNNEDDRQGQSPVSFTSIKEDAENNLTACMTIRYKDLVKEVFTYKPQSVIHTNASIDNNLSNESDSGMTSMTNRVEVTTTTTTVADIFIHISSATESFQQSNPSKYPSSGKETHQVTLSATTSTSEIDLDFNTESFEDFSIKKVDRIKQHWKENQYRWADVNAQLVFSANGKHLSCLIPRPIRVSTKENKKEGSQNNRENGMNGHGVPKEAAMSTPSIHPIKLPGISTVVIFTLQSPTIENRQTAAGDNINQIDDSSISMSGDLLPQPTYLKHDVEQDSNRRNHHKHASQSSQGHTILPPIPGKPHVLSLNPNMFTNMEMEMNNRSQRASKLLSQITCLCDVNHLHTKHRQNDKNPATHKGAPLLLAGCTDGSILLIAQKRAMLLGMLYDNHEYDFSRTRLHASVGWNDHPEGVQTLKYYTDTSQLKEENKSWSVKGRFLVVRRDGTAVIYSTTFRDAVGALEKTYTGERMDEREGQAADENAILLPESQSSGNSQLGFTLQYLKWASKNYSFKMTIDLFCNNFGMAPNTAEEPAFFVNGTWVDLNTVAMLTKPLHFSSQDASQNAERRGVIFINNIAQVWSIQECGMQCYLLAELNIDKEKLQEVQNGYFDGFSSSNSVVSLSPNSVHDTFIEHDIYTGCLLIKSSISSSRSAKAGVVEGRHFISIWHWASCTIGFTLTSLKETQFIMQDSTASASFVCPAPVYSHFNFHRGRERTTLIHTYGRGTYRRDVYLVGILSPSSFQRCLETPNPIFLSNNSVSYPDLLEPSVGKEIHIGWKYSKIPPIYQEGQGPVEIAAIANSFGRSLAISGSRGLCVLDIHRDDTSIVSASLGSQSPSSLLQLPTSCHEGFECRKDTFQLRTKQDRWRMFSRQEETSFAVKAVTWWEDASDRCEDTIVAVIQYVESLDPSYYIVAWSSRRLGMGNLQLLNDLHESNNSNHLSNKGIRLPAGFTPNQISILAENSQEKKNRATLLMTGATNVKGEAPYLLVHLQCKHNTRSKEQGILGSVISKGMIQLLVSPSDFIFLAGSSFHFDLQHKVKESKIRNEKRIATLGIVHDHGLAISAVSIAGDNVQCKTNILHLGDADDLNGVADRITKVWLGNFDRFPTYSSDRSGTWTWSFMKSSGGIFSWAIDGEVSYEKEDCPVQNIALHHSVRCKNICSCHFGIKSDEKRCLKGSISDERTSILGPLPSTNHKHLLYSGQKSQICQQPLAHFGLYGVSDFDIGIPSSTASFLLSLSQIVDLFLNDKAVLANAMIIGLSHDIQRMHSYETTFAGLRTIVSFITERESELERQGTREALERYNFLHTMQSALAQITLSALIQLQFVSLFLNVGRQLEPHHFHSLFPLSLSTTDNNPNHSLALQDLFDIAVVEGSFSVPAAALPLFSNKRKVHNLCVNLLHHCITTLFDFSDPKSVDVGCLREEFRSFQQLFSYTSKLEDSNFASYGIDPDGNLHDDHTTTSNDASIGSSCDRNTADHSSNDGFSIVDSISGSSYEEQKEMSSPGKIERIAALIRPLVSTSGKGEESAISDAASSFILSGYKDTPCYSKDSDRSESDDSSLSEVGSSDSDLSASTDEEEERATFSSAGLIGMSICSTVFLSKISSMKSTTFGLKNVAILSHLLCTENMTKTESSIQLDIVQKIIGTVPIEGVRRSLHILENLETLNRDIVPAENPEALLLTHLLIETSQLWDIDSSEAVIKTIVNILSRQEQAPEVKTFAPLLFLLLISACHLVDRVPLLFGDNDNCDLMKIYRIAVQDIEEVKNIAKSK